MYKKAGDIPRTSKMYSLPLDAAKLVSPINSEADPQYSKSSNHCSLGYRGRSCSSLHPLQLEALLYLKKHKHESYATASLQNLLEGVF
ncbi:hypothetical protein SLA2020_192680 [Shorea laevis]